MANSLWHFARSSTTFLLTVAYKSMFAGILLLFHWSNFYWQKLKFYLPDGWEAPIDKFMSVFEDWTLWLALLIICSAILHTYWEAAREIREPKVTRKLKEFYLRFDQLLGSPIGSAVEVEKLENDFDRLRKETYAWISNNMDSASVTRLGQKQRSGFAQFRMQRQDGFNVKHGELMDSLIDCQDQLIVLIERVVWV